MVLGHPGPLCHLEDLEILLDQLVLLNQWLQKLQPVQEVQWILQLLELLLIQ
jgi:hypothetical protein